MKNVRLNPFLFVMLVLFFLAGVGFPSNVWASDCSNTSVGLTPINDLGTGFYQGQQGGLYGGGTNTRPAQHTARGLAMAAKIRPLNSEGQVDLINGKIAFISVGMSNTRDNFAEFIPMAESDPDVNSHIVVVQCALGGHDVQDWLSESDNTVWNNCAGQLAAKDLTVVQVQGAWMYHHLREERFPPNNPFPGNAHYLEGLLKNLIHKLKTKYSNLHTVYLSGREYGGYGAKHPEPDAYENKVLS